MTLKCHHYWHYSRYSCCSCCHCCHYTKKLPCARLGGFHKNTQQPPWLYKLIRSPAGVDPWLQVLLQVICSHAQPCSKEPTPCKTNGTFAHIAISRNARNGPLHKGKKNSFKNNAKGQTFHRKIDSSSLTWKLYDMQCCRSKDRKTGSCGLNQHVVLLTQSAGCWFIEVEFGVSWTQIAGCWQKL
jgi:hypothetical protein